MKNENRQTRAPLVYICFHLHLPLLPLVQRRKCAAPVITQLFLDLETLWALGPALSHVLKVLFFQLFPIPPK